ncbi:MAG: histidine kinase [Prevotellaceae bacterium]|jgi:LytS/YehU family sensor histidine kinase|nr:histidine kinase [Prevotellaceae bacterium]
MNPTLQLLVPTGCLIIFYLNYAWFIDRYFFRKRILRFVAVNLLCIALLNVPGLLAHPGRMAPPHHPGKAFFPHRLPPMGAPFFIHIALLAAAASAALAVKATTRWYKAQAAMATLEKEKSVAELQQLKSQLNPHFLFNSLNNIYALVDLDPARARQAIHTLGEMLRHQLYEATQETIPLHKEIDFIRNYCRLMQLRLPKNVTLLLDLPDNDNDCHIAIAPLLFVPLVENAFKHGVSPSQPSRIDVAIGVIDRRSPVCTVRNSFFPKNSDDRSGSGIGLGNLRKRLDLLYPQQYRWRVGRTGEEFVAEIILYPA